MEHGRLFTDSTGVEWEVYDESQWSIAMALDWDYPPQVDDFGLLFDSPVGKRRVFPCPKGWKSFSDPELEALLHRARSLT